MKFKNDFPKDYEWILNKNLDSDKPYEFEIWKHGFAEDTIAEFKTKTASEMARKINSLVIKLNKNK